MISQEYPKTGSGLKTGFYCGEWSSQTHKPHGRGVFIRDDGLICIKAFFDGSTKVAGKFIAVNSADEVFYVGFAEFLDNQWCETNKSYLLNGTVKESQFVNGQKIA